MKESSPSTSEVVESRLPSPHLINLHRDILYLILEKLDGVSLVNLSCCCKLLRAFGTDPASARVWAALVRRRWRNVNTLPYTRAASTPRRPAEPYSSKGSGLAPDSNADTSDSAAGSTAAKDASSSIQPDWKRLYSQENGWKGRLGVARLGDSYGGYCFGLHLFKSSDLGWDFPGGSAENEFVLATISDNQEDWIAGWTFSSTPPGNQDLSCGPDWVRDAYSWVSHRHASPRLSGPVLALPDKPLVAIGATAGTVCLEEPYGCQLRRVRQLHTGNARQSVYDIQCCRGRGRLFTCNVHSHHSVRNTITAFDIEAGRCIATAEEFFDGSDIWCMCPGEDGDTWGNVLIAGTAHGGCATCCTSTNYPSLCFHKSCVHTAGISVYDVRASLAMASRYSTHHRSLFPRLLRCRSHFILTSHAGNPLCVWDLRQMSMPVYEEERLGNFSPMESYPMSKYPLGAPWGPSVSQGLYLDSDGDVLLGRADNGMVWKWDLSKTMGWSDGSGSGSWRHLAAASYSDQDEHSFRDWPVQLGAWPSHNSIISVRGGRRCCLVGTQAEDEIESGFIAAVSMQG